MKFSKYILLIILVSVLFGCDSDKREHVFVKSKEIGSIDGRATYVTVTLANDGDLPAYFVLLHIKIMLDGKEIKKIDYEFGDIFPGGQVTETIEFEGLMYKPDYKLELNLTYTRPYAGSNSVGT